MHRHERLFLPECRIAGSETERDRAVEADGAERRDVLHASGQFAPRRAGRPGPLRHWQDPDGEQQQRHLQPFRRDRPFVHARRRGAGQGTLRRRHGLPGRACPLQHRRLLRLDGFGRRDELERPRELGRQRSRWRASARSRIPARHGRAGSSCGRGASS